MAGLVPAIHVFVFPGNKDVDARDPSTPRLRRATNSLGRRSFSEDGKRGHDDSVKSYPALALQMASFVALLRAVNVGGTGKLPMTELKAMCAELGFTSVRTYIASGNVGVCQPQVGDRGQGGAGEAARRLCRKACRRDGAKCR